MRKGFYPYEYMHDWEIFNKTSLFEKEDFYSNLSMEDISDADYTYTKRRILPSVWAKRYIIVSRHI